MTMQKSEQEIRNDLQELADNIYPDTRFVAALDLQLRTVPLQRKSVVTRNRQRYTRIAVVIAAVFIGAFVGTWSVPELRAVAQEIVAKLFNRAESDTATFTYRYDGRSTPASTFTTIAQAQAVAQFTIREPKAIPFAFTLQTINASASVVDFVYVVPGRELIITEQTLSHGWQNGGLIGASAKIENINLGGITGEYVEGTWIVTVSPPAPAQGNLVTEVAQWRPDVSWRQLRWQDGGLLYEIISRGGSSDIPERYIGLNEMVAIAKTLR